MKATSDKLLDRTMLPTSLVSIDDAGCFVGNGWAGKNYKGKGRPEASSGVDGER